MFPSSFLVTVVRCQGMSRASRESQSKAIAGVFKFIYRQVYIPSIAGSERDPSILPMKPG